MSFLANPKSLRREIFPVYIAGWEYGTKGNLSSGILTAVVNGIVVLLDDLVRTAQRAGKRNELLVMGIIRRKEKVMTKEEILAIESGRKLDGLVAKEVMGIEVEYPFAEGYPYYLTEDKYAKKRYSPAKVWDAVALYSTEVSPAWQVVEKLGGAWDIRRRFRPHPDDPPGSPGRPTYQAKVFLSDYVPEEDELTNERTGRSPWVWSLPEAICKASLLAKLESV